MRKFLNNTRGAVTIFITLLLIPAMLISGTAVDLTRIYTVQSIVQDANQLAANAVLTQYNALLHDLYGVFGIAENDPILAELLNEYISITVFGEDTRDTSMGTLQLFYGSNLNIDEVYFTSGQNLRNPDVLRRQIEEYMKFRGPVIIVQELFELIGSTTFKEDTEVIEKKLEVDEAIADMYDKYKELYDAILIADECDGFNGVGGMIGPVGTGLQTIRGEFADLKACMEDWEAETGKEEGERDQSKIDKLETLYTDILKSIQSRISGGKTRSGSSQGIYATIETAINRADGFKSKFDDVVKIAKELDAMRDELERKINALEERLKNGECNEELRASLTERLPGSDKSIIEMYKDILKWEDVESMAITFKEGGYEYIDGPVKEMLRGVKYRNKYNASDPQYELAQLERASMISELSLRAGNSTVSRLPYPGDRPTTYGMPDGFIKFKGHPGDNEAFFNDLEEMMAKGDLPPVALYEGQEEADGDGTKEKQKNMINELMELVDSAYAGLTNTPMGAKYVNGETVAEDIENASNITKAVSDASSNSFINVISDPIGTVGRAGDYLLLLTYCTSMFSCYTTARPEANGKTIDNMSEITFPESISGAQISPKVNYFFQSELEYLYKGNDNAGKNLSAVSRLIYLVRVICNYITVFSVSDVTHVVNYIRTAFAWSPPLGLMLGELARAAFVAAESAVDVATLRAGYKVPLIKSSSNWICSPKGLAKALGDILSDTVKKDDNTDGKGLLYTHYLLFFFLAEGLINSNMATELTERTADLMEWNVINYKSRLLCDEVKMSEALSAESRFKLSNMKTDFSVTTTVDMRMLFLSMVFAQDFADSNGISMPRTIPVTVTDYRGY